MLRQFSIRRTVGAFLFDWLGSLACLLLANQARRWVGVLPGALGRLLQGLYIPSGGIEAADGLPHGLSLLPVVILVGLIWPVFFLVFSVYDGRRSSSLKKELLTVFTAVSISMLVLAGALFFSFRDTSRLMMLLFYGFDLALLLIGRVGLSYRSRRRVSGLDRRRRVVVIGAGRVGVQAAENIQRYALNSLELVGYLDDNPQKHGQILAGHAVLGSLDQITAAAAQYKITDAVIALPMEAHARLVQVCQAVQKHSIRAHVIPDLFVLSFPNATLEGFGGIPAIDLGEPGITGWKRFWKRAFDLAAVTAGLVLAWPALGLIALAIKLDSPGPVFYRQTRVGENGKTFTMFKFRSMQTNSDPSVHQAHVKRLIEQNLKPEQLGQGRQSSLKLENDPRITRVGRFIRKTSLDEVPQIINVLRGEMSLVGPRPPLAYEVELYKEWQKQRFEAPPGMTGLWQVKGRNRVSFEEMVRLDLDYIKNQSVWLDIKIILQTPWAMFSGKGAG
jgi:exopolysaccharide biosynthesis polyprenyl glycosylphosphotransferase